MQSSWIGWIAFIVLGTLITVSSCQAYLGSGPQEQTTQKAED